MGIFFRQKSTGGGIMNKSRVAAVDLSKKTVLKKVDQLSFTNRASKLDAKKFFKSARQGGLEKKEAIGFLRKERSEGRITKNSTRKVGYEMGLTKGDMKKVFSAKSQEGSIKSDSSAKKEMPSNVIKLQPRKTIIRDSQSIPQDTSVSSLKSNSKIKTKKLEGDHFVSAKSSSTAPVPSQFDVVESVKNNDRHIKSVYDIIREKDATNNEN